MHLKDASLLKNLAFINGAWIGADDGATHGQSRYAQGARFHDANGSHGPCGRGGRSRPLALF